MVAVFAALPKYFLICIEFSVFLCYNYLETRKYLVRGLVFMFALIENLFLKNRARKILLYIEKVETALTLFQIIDSREAKNEKFIRSLSKKDLYADIVSRYNVCIQKIEKHNKEIQALTFSYNTLLQTYPIADILENILICSKGKIEEIYSTIKKVYAYVVPDTFQNKKQYDTYKQNIEEILRDHDLIKEQKNLILKINDEIEKLPDVYIDSENMSQALEGVLKSVEKYASYERLYYQIPVVNAATIDKHNEKFIARHLNDSIFDNVNGKSLDIEQRRAVLCDAKSNLTIAGAGSGKTLTICGKVKYLLEKGLARNNEILLLSYSRASADDLESKVNKVATGLTVETFHALGLKILTEASGKKKAVEEQLRAYITRFFEEELVKNPKIANEIFQYIALYFYAAPVHKKKYKNDGEIFKELKVLDFRTLKDRLGKLSANTRRHETLKNEFVKSNEELVIANYLFINGIKYEYEKPYEIETSTIEKRQYTPDFYLPDYGIYIEHYGIDRKGNAPQYEKEASDEYVRSMNWKRQIHSENHTKCIETFSYEFNEGIIFDNLKARLLENGVEFRPLSQEEVFNALHNVYTGRDFSSFFNLIMTFISLYKAQIKDDTGFETLKLQLSDCLYDTSRTRLFLDVCKNIYNYYIENLRAADKIDFDDMILQSIDLLDGTLDFKYKYIIVDEFQDISQSRTKFLQKLIEHGNSKLFAVGDDWQAIYRFAGCDINVFLEFENIFKGAKLNYITSTHRNSEELQRIVEPFITANPSQYKKHIKSAKHQEKPVRIIFHKGNKAKALVKAIEDISAINSNAKVLVLGRNRRDIDAFICRDIQVLDYKNIMLYSFPKLEISYSTVHGSKGLESDFVVVISGEDAQNGFPNKTEDDNVLTLLLGKKDNFEYAEERRLFYVALTRTKSVVYLLSDRRRPSVFIQEIKNKCYIMEDESEGETAEEYLCPWCKSGRLIIRRSDIDGSSFYGCSNFPYCSYTNSDVKAVYNNNRCPECGDFLVLRKGRYGTFLGCHNFPRCKYTRQVVQAEKNRIGFHEK